MVSKKRNLEEIREHKNDESSITRILGVSAEELDSFKHDVCDEFRTLYDECETAVAAGLFLLDRVLKIENPDPDTVARAICLHELLRVGCAIQCKTLMDELQQITSRHPAGLCAIGLRPPRSIFERPKLMVLACDGDADDDSACDHDPEQDVEDAERLSYIR
jgi:hypothetical protein